MFKSGRSSYKSVSFNNSCEFVKYNYIQTRDKFVLTNKNLSVSGINGNPETHKEARCNQESKWRKHINEISFAEERKIENIVINEQLLIEILGESASMFFAYAVKRISGSRTFFMDNGRYLKLLKGKPYPKGEEARKNSLRKQMEVDKKDFNKLADIKYCKECFDNALILDFITLSNKYLNDIIDDNEIMKEIIEKWFEFKDYNYLDVASDIFDLVFNVINKNNVRKEANKFLKENPKHDLMIKYTNRCSKCYFLKNKEEKCYCHIENKLDDPKFLHYTTAGNLQMQYCIEEIY